MTIKVISIVFIHKCDIGYYLHMYTGYSKKYIYNDIRKYVKKNGLVNGSMFIKFSFIYVCMTQQKKKWIVHRIWF